MGQGLCRSDGKEVCQQCRQCQQHKVSSSEKQEGEKVEIGAAGLKYATSKRMRRVVIISSVLAPMILPGVEQRNFKMRQ